jgi:large subunit ribosomal protein L6
VIVPAGVKVALDGMTVKAEGPKGKLSFTFRPEVTVKLDGQQIVVGRKNESKLARALHGTTRAILQNMLKGCAQGYLKTLDIVGVGWSVKLDGKKVSMQVGFCHAVELPVPEGVTVKLPNPQRIEVSGADKQAVGHFAASLRKVKPPEPYKGKGVRYTDEHVERKAGKSFVGGAGGKK